MRAHRNRIYQAGQSGGGAAHGRTLGAQREAGSEDAPGVASCNRWHVEGGEARQVRALLEVLPITGGRCVEERGANTFSGPGVHVHGLIGLHTCLLGLALKKSAFSSCRVCVGGSLAAVTGHRVSGKW